MVSRITILSALVLFSFGAQAQKTSDTKHIQIALEKLRVGTDTSKYWEAISHTISNLSTHRQGTTAKAVYDFVIGDRVNIIAGTGISVTGTYPNKTITNTASPGIPLDSVRFVSSRNAYCKSKFISEYEAPDSNVLVIVLGDSKTEATYRGPRWLGLKLSRSRGGHGGPGFGVFGATPPAGVWYSQSGTTTVETNNANTAFSLVGKGLTLGVSGVYTLSPRHTYPEGRWTKITYRIKQNAGSSSTIDVSIDGGAATTITVPAGSGVSTFTATVADATHTVVFTRTSGTPTLLDYILDRQISNSSSVWNMGHAGSTAASWLTFLDSDWNIIKPYDPDMFIVRLGTNDVYGSVGSATYEANMRSLTALIRTKFPRANITLVGTEENSGPSDFGEYRDAAAQIAWDSCYSYVDASLIFPDWVEATADGLTEDTVHESEAGGVIVGNAYFDAIFGKSTPPNPAASTDVAGINYWTLLSGNVYRSTGNVGINTSTPETALQLSGTAPKITITASTSGNSGIQWGAGSTFDASIFNNIVNGETRFSSGRSVGWGGWMSWYIDQVEAMRLSPLGRLGIGTTIFNRKLTVGDAIAAGTDEQFAGSRVLVGRTNTEGYSHIGTRALSGDFYMGAGMQEISSTATWLSTNADPIGRSALSVSQYGLDFYYATPQTTAVGSAITGITNPLRIFGGNTAIGGGIASPAEKLEVNGTTKTVGFKMPTGAVNNYILRTDGSGTGTWSAETPGGHTIRDDGTDMTQRAALNFVSTSTVAAAATDDAGNGETEIRLTVPTNGITATEIAADAVGSSEIAADAVGPSELAPTAVTPGTYTNATITLDQEGRATAASSGTAPVTSVALSLPTSVFDISGSPVTSAGTLTAAFDNQSANTFFRGPTSGGAATPAFGPLVAADITGGGGIVGSGVGDQLSIFSGTQTIYGSSRFTVNNSTLAGLIINGGDGAGAMGSYILFKKDGVNNFIFGAESSLFGGTGTGGAIFQYGNNPFFFCTNSTKRMTITGAGDIGINTTSPAQTVHVAGTARITGSDGTATSIMGRDADGDISTIGAGASSGQVLKWNGSTWAPATDGGADGNGIYSGSGSIPSGGSTVTVTDANKLIFTSTESSGNQVRFNMTQGSGIQFNNNSGTQLNRTYSTGSEFINESATRQQTIQAATSVNLKATDGTKSATFKVHEDNYVVFPDFSAFPSVASSNKTGWNAVLLRLQYAVSGVGHTVADLERDFAGSAFTIRTADFTLGASNILSEIIDCNAGAVVVTLGADLREGFDYVVKCRRNGTNTVTFTADGSHVFEIDGISTLAPTTLVVGSAGTGVEAPHKVYTIRRSGVNIFIK